MSQSTSLYVYVGEGTKTSNNVYSFNGGGPSQYYNGLTGSSGGGGTDVRMTMHNTSDGWGRTDAVSLRSRIIVAGGSSPGADGSRLSLHSACAGGLNGYSGTHYSGRIFDDQCGRGGGQTSGGAVPAVYSTGSQLGEIGHFGYGGKGGRDDSQGASNGGGGGWYGASGATGASVGAFSGAGGSSFISGHYGCNGINSSGTHQGASNPSKVLFDRTGSEQTITFSNTKMIDGGGYRWDSASNHSSKEQMPRPEGGYYATGQGHYGNGYCKITYTRQ